MRLSRSLAVTALTACTFLAGTAAIAAPAAPAKPAAPAAQPARTANPDMLIATVGGAKITLGDIQRAAQSLPPSVRQLNMKPELLLSLLAHQLIDQKVVQIMAEKEKLEDKPAVKAAMTAAADNVLQNAYLEQQIAPKINEAAIKAYYDAHYANQKPEEEVHARHILVDSEAQAKDIIKQLDRDHGANFAKLAATLSADKGTASHDGGDLGWFKKGDMIPAFSKAAFSLKPGTISQTPIQTQYGWHVIQVLGTRMVPVPTLEQAHDHIKNELVRQGIRQVIDKASKDVKVVYYNADGKPMAQPPAAVAKPAAQPAK
ncbi:peptidylprolyl isomerase [Oecophyllibacter saccharovorans]|uniref:peptidylprolyl isomerase n=1 Tax=Oecophyllibacter saccharovorans TaxID=2558360 RepID=UPI0011677B88|nr:peptidylprolyl isomerase [Oecophyllibacter saccharovorans]TPW36541.1 peptidylprolyl isomerase [Oecophyllibacter saccharovorans]